MKICNSGFGWKETIHAFVVNKRRMLLPDFGTGFIIEREETVFCKKGGMEMSSMTIGSGLYRSYSHIASGKRINTAADDAAGLAIGQKLKRQENGLSVAAGNASDGIGAMNVADGALDGMLPPED